MQRHSLFLLSLLSLLLASCSVSRHIGPNDRVLKENVYEVAMEDGSAPPKEIKEALKGLKKYTEQSPNPSFLGIRWGMRIYCFSIPGDTNWFSHYLRNTGNAPEVYSADAALRTTEQIQSLLQSKGCFTSTVAFDTFNLKEPNTKVVYRITPSPRYLIDRVSFEAETDEVATLINQQMKESLLKKDDYYDADIVAAERDRLTTLLRNEGYYYANKDNILFYIDTANEDGTLNIRVRVRNHRGRNAQGDIVSLPFRKQYIDRILFYPNGNTSSTDTLVFPFQSRRRISNYLFLDPEHISLSPQVIANSMFLFQGQTYRERSVSTTYNSLLALRNLKYINIEFTPSPRTDTDSALLDAHIRLIPSKRQRLSLSLEVNNANGMQDSNSNKGLFGLEAVLRYQNKNLFRKHAGILTLDLSGLLEIPKNFFANSSDNTVAAFGIGANATLDLPTLLLLPINRDRVWLRSRPHTLFSIGGNYQDRTYLKRRLANLSVGYSWSQNRQVKHSFKPFELTFASYPYIDGEFLNRLMSSTNNYRLLYQYSDHLILDANYEYEYSNQAIGVRQDFTYLRLSAESAGNLFYAIDKVVGFPKDENNVSEVLGVPYSQYVRLQGEAKHYYYYGQRCSFVSRLLLGVGIPLGNSKGMQMPYEKSFFGGGPNTMRAWPLRYLGPGMSANEGYTIEHTGDMTLVLNLENRFPLFSIVEGALFADIGNVWNVYPDDLLSGANLTLRNFVPSLAVGSGLGLRFNVSILTVRVDMGLPIYDPGYAEGQRWRLRHWGDYEFNLGKLIFGPVTLNFGIDYPF